MASSAAAPVVLRLKSPATLQPLAPIVDGASLPAFSDAGQAKTRSREKTFAQGPKREGRLVVHSNPSFTQSLTGLQGFIEDRNMVH